jgi:hypothetical protein
MACENKRQGRQTKRHLELADISWTNIYWEDGIFSIKSV